MLFKFVFCGDTASDVSFGHVFVKHNLNLVKQKSVHVEKSFRYVLMYGGFRNAEFFSRGANGRVVLNDEAGAFQNPLINIILHHNPRHVLNYMSENVVYYGKKDESGFNYQKVIF